MTAIFLDMLEYRQLDFMDDFSIFDVFRSNLQKVLGRCQKMNIVFGYKISQKGIEIDRTKIEVLTNYLPQPRRSECYLLLDMRVSIFHRRFIKDYSKISKSLSNLLQKDVDFEFDDDCMHAFETLKKALISAPIVQASD